MTPATEYKLNPQGKFSAITLVKTYFGATMNEMKDLPAKDRNELASAIARQEQIPADQLGFDLVPY